MFSILIQFLSPHSKGNVYVSYVFVCLSVCRLCRVAATTKGVPYASSPVNLPPPVKFVVAAEASW